MGKVQGNTSQQVSLHGRGFTASPAWDPNSCHTRMTGDTHDRGQVPGTHDRGQVPGMWIDTALGGVYEMTMNLKK